MSVRTTCSGCNAPVVIHGGSITAHHPSNGRRGQFHRPAADLTTDAWYQESGLLSWTCPICEYEDSWEDE